MVQEVLGLERFNPIRDRLFNRACTCNASDAKLIGTLTFYIEAIERKVYGEHENKSHKMNYKRA